MGGRTIVTSLPTELVLNSLNETLSLGKMLASSLKPNSIVAFFGELGSGKTTLIKGIAKHLNFSHDDVNSPTFTYLNIYPAKYPIYHFDLYRLKTLDQFINMGFEDYFFQNGICLIEWADLVYSILPPSTIKVRLSSLSTSQRKVEIEI